MMDLRRLKAHVRCNFDSSHPLCVVLLAEPDEVPMDDVLLGKLLALLRLTYPNRQD